MWRLKFRFSMDSRLRGNEGLALDRKSVFIECIRKISSGHDPRRTYLAAMHA